MYILYIYLCIHYIELHTHIQVSAAEAQRHAYRLLKEGNMEAVKLEGADNDRLRTVEVLVKGGIAVMGHIGLTPQSYSTLGGFRAQVCVCLYVCLYMYTYLCIYASLSWDL